jgi:hypothetical protein
VLQPRVFWNGKFLALKTNLYPAFSTTTISPELAPATTSTITITALGVNEELVPGYVFEVNAQVSSCLARHIENYMVNGVQLTHDSLGIKLPATDVNGQTSFDVSLPANIDPADGISLNLFYKGD